MSYIKNSSPVASSLQRWPATYDSRVPYHRHRSHWLSHYARDAIYLKTNSINLKGTKLVLVSGAGLIGSHTADLLLNEDVKEILIYDDFVRGGVENWQDALKDPRVKTDDVGSDMMQTDILQSAFDGANGAFHFAALYCCNAAITRVAPSM